MADAFLEPVEDAVLDLVSRFARTHTPFTAGTAAEQLGLSLLAVEQAPNGLLESERVVCGEFLPGGHRTEWCDTEVFRRLKRRSLTALRKEAGAVDAETLVRFLADWQGVTSPRQGLDGLLDVVEQLQGTSFFASTLEREVLPVRLRQFRSAHLDELCVAAEIIWRGLESRGATDGRIALYLSDHYLRLAAPVDPLEDLLAD